jgi:hypothetical protein
MSLRHTSTCSTLHQHDDNAGVNIIGLTKVIANSTMKCQNAKTVRKLINNEKE